MKTNQKAISLTEFTRRDFLRLAGSAGAAIIVAGCGGGGGGGGAAVGGGGTVPPGPAAETLNFTITDALKEMVTHEPNNPAAGAAECYFWVFKEARFPADCPGPQIFAITGDTITVNVTNSLDGPHAFAIPGLGVTTGSIAPGATATVAFTAGAPGTYLYYDNLNAPVNRVMGLHGAFVIMPAAAAAGRQLTPYANPTASVQQLFDDFGAQTWWPGLAWGAGDTVTDTAAARQHVWLAHQASPVLFEQVGLFARANPGVDFSAATFIEAFCNDPFINTSNDDRTITNAAHPVKFNETVTLANGTTMVRGVFNRKPHFFTINGQSGFFAHHNPAVVPMYRVGEPCLVRILNAGLWSHCFHLHANHFYVTAIDNVPSDNPLWLDVFNIKPLLGVDYVIPFMRPPDVPNTRGIGRADVPLPTVVTGHPAWPPREELERNMPNLLDITATNFAGTAIIDLAVHQAPLCYPMHDHSEPSQTAQGGNYNSGLIAGMYILGDRNTPGSMDFSLEDDFEMMLELGRHTGETGPPVGGWPPETVIPV